MQLLQFAATVLLSFMGMPAGYFLASITKEELPTAKKYFPFLTALVFVAAIALSANYYNLKIAVKAALYIIATLAFAVKANSAVLYFILGVIIGFASRSAEAVMVLSSLVFLFGLLAGSTSFRKRLEFRELLPILAKNSVYIAGAFLAFEALMIA